MILENFVPHENLPQWLGQTWQGELFWATIYTVSYLDRR